MSTRPPRNDALRKRYRRKVQALGHPCGICNEPIDYSLQHPDPMSCVVDHIVPLNKGGADDYANLQAAHRTCNRDKSDKTADEVAALTMPRTFVTHRTW